MISMGRTLTAVPPDIAGGQYYLADDRAPHDARLHVRARLGTWRLGHLAEALQLIASELVTNAIQHAAGSDVVLWLALTDASVVIRVWDANPNPPTPAEAGDLDESGRGLALVTALSARSGWYPFSGGKVAFAEVMK